VTQAWHASGSPSASLALVNSDLSRYVTGGALVLVIAAGFEFELAWLFLLGLVMFAVWAGYMLLRTGD
jgi:hypothetical protein